MEHVSSSSRSADFTSSQVVNDVDELERFLNTAAVVAPDYPVVISKYAESGCHMTLGEG